MLVQQDAAGMLEWSKAHPCGVFPFRKQQDGEYLKIVAEVEAGRLFFIYEGPNHMGHFCATPAHLL